MINQVHNGRHRELYYFRDEQGLEVDFILPGHHGVLTMVECKAGRTVKPAMANALLRLKAALRKQPGRGRELRAVVVHQSPKLGSPMTTLAPGVEALPRGGFLETL